MSRARNLFISAIIVFLLLPGCAVHRPQEIATPGRVPESFKNEAGHYKETFPIGRWWIAFGDERLDALVTEALASNLDLDASFARYRQSVAVASQASSPKYPTLNLEGDAGRSQRPGIFGEDRGSSYSLSLSAGYEVDLWKKVSSAASAASLIEEASLEDVRSLYITITAELVDLYYLAVEQRSQIDLADQAIASVSDTLIRVTSRYRQGLVPALDVYQARQNLAAAKASRPAFESNLASAEHAIAVILGNFPGEKIEGVVAELPTVSENFPAGIPSDVLADRPDVRSAFLRVKASDEEVAEAIADRFPSFNLLASYGRSSTAFSGGDLTGIFWNAIVNLTQPLIDGGRRKAEVDRRQAQFQENLALYRKQTLTSIQEVEDALVANRTTEERIKRLEEEVDASSGSLRLSTDRYLQGLSDYLPVLTAQSSYFTARSRLLAERRQLISNRISLARALGGNWMEGEVDKRIEASNREGDSR